MRVISSDFSFYNKKVRSKVKDNYSSIVGVKQSREYEAHAGKTVHVISRSEKNVQTTSSSGLLCKFFHLLAWKCLGIVKRYSVLNKYPESALNRHMSIIQDKLSIYMKLTTKEHTKVNVKVSINIAGCQPLSTTLWISLKSWQRVIIFDRQKKSLVKSYH